MSYQPKRESRSEFLNIRGLRYHLRHWGDDGAPLLFLLHGWLDCSATFQFVVDAFEQDWHVVSPDWRGFGLSEWCPQGYWFPDYLADFEAIVDHCSPDDPILLAGHSLGAQASSMFAGLRPSRVSRLVCLDGLNVPDMSNESPVRRLRYWLDQLREPILHKDHESFDALSLHLRKYHPTLAADKADFIARCWGRETDDGRVALLADPQHRIQGPMRYLVEDSMAVWKEVTAPVLCIDGEDSMLRQRLGDQETQRRRASFPHQKTVVISSAGHMVHHDQPEEIARRIEAFFLD